MTAAELAEADIVLTTFDVLANDVNHDADKSGGRPVRGNRVRRFPTLATPLVRLRWWRVVIDEAQMIEGAHKLAAQMANHLTMVNRWCVTGTPISRSVNDLQGLIQFLKVCLPILLPYRCSSACRRACAGMASASTGLLCNTPQPAAPSSNVC